MVALITTAILAFFILILYLHSILAVCDTPTQTPAERDEVVITICGGLVSGTIVTIGAMVPGFADPSENLLRTFGSPIRPLASWLVNIGLALYALGYLYALWKLYDAWSANATPLIKSSFKAYLAVGVTAVAALLGVQNQVG